jgi:hypothetical protein
MTSDLLVVLEQNEALGYNQVDCAIASYLSAEHFARIPSEVSHVFCATFCNSEY